MSVGAECTIYGGVIGFQTGASSPFRTISQIEVLSVIYILSRIVSSLCVYVIALHGCHIVSLESLEASFIIISSRTI